MFEIIIRCGYGDMNELGTGHLNRSLNIIRFLKSKNKIESKKILLVINNSNKSIEAKKLINKYDKKIQIRFIKKTKTNNSINFLKNLTAKLIIFDSLTNLSSSKLRIIRKKFNKIILFDDDNFESNEFDLKINSLIFKKSLDTSKKIYGFKFNLLSSYFSKLRAKKTRNKFFIFFGGHDHNKYTIKFIDIISKIKLNNYVFYFDKKFKNTKLLKLNYIKFYDRNSFNLHLASSEVVICSGGLIAFEGIYYNKKVFCIPQFEHQRVNIVKLEKMGLVKQISIQSLNSILYDRKKSNFSVNKIINKPNILKTFLKIDNIYKRATN